MVDTLSVGGNLADIAVTPDGNNLYVVNYRDDTVLVVGHSE